MSNAQPAIFASWRVQMRKDVIRFVLIPFLAFVLGTLAFGLQYVADGAPKPVGDSYAYMTLAHGSVGTISITALVVVAFALGYFTNSPPLLVGLCMVQIFPILVMLEANGNPNTHNMFPFEIVMYAFCSLPLALVAWLGVLASRRFHHGAGDATQAGA